MVGYRLMRNVILAKTQPGEYAAITIMIIFAYHKRYLTFKWWLISSMPWDNMCSKR
jgi:hypothetical protein